MEHLNCSKEINIVVTETDLDDHPTKEIVQPFIFITTPTQILFTWAAPKPANLTQGTDYLFVFIKILAGEKEFPEPTEVWEIVKEEMLTGTVNYKDRERTLLTHKEDLATSFCKGTNFLCAIGGSGGR